MSILSDRFRNRTGKYMTDRKLTGICLSDVPLDVNEGGTAAHDTVLRVTLDIPESELAEWELVEEGKPYREWLIPARIINQCGVISIVGDEEELP